jgi:hypothetical protein
MERQQGYFDYSRMRDNQMPIAMQLRTRFTQILEEFIFILLIAQKHSFYCDQGEMNSS